MVPPGKRPGTEIDVRPARRSDLGRITEIYNHYVTRTAVTFDTAPFTVRDRLPWWSQFAETGRHRLLVATASEAEVVGYAGSTRFRPKPAYDPTVETTIYCAPEAVGHGVGATLYARLFDELAVEDVTTVVAAFTLPNAASAALHARFGFRPVGVFRRVGRKFGRYWDVQWMSRALRAARTRVASHAQPRRRGPSRIP